MNYVVLWALPMPFGELLARVWIWPVLVCLAAWLFRRHVLVNEGAGSRFRLPGGSMRFSSPRPGRAADAHSAGGSIPQPENLDGNARRAHWWSFITGRTAASERVSVRARKALGPQLQFLVLCVGNREYHILSQAGAAPLVLSTWGDGAPQADQGMAAKRSAASSAPRNRRLGIPRGPSVAHRQPRQVSATGQAVVGGLKPSLPGVNQRGMTQHGVIQ